MRIHPSLLLPLVCIAQITPLAAQTTGNIQGIVKDAKGNPIPKATISLSRIGTHWVKELTSGSDGKFLQVGLDPREYDITVSAPGFINFQEREKINLGQTSIKTYTLMTKEEAHKNTADNQPQETQENQITTLYNKAVVLYNEKKFQTARPLFDQVTALQQDAITKATSETTKIELAKQQELTQKPYAICLMQCAKTDDVSRKECHEKAEPILKKLHTQNPKDANYVIYLIEIAKSRNDAASAKHYQEKLNEIQGPRPEVPFNEGVEYFNANKMKEAKVCFKKAIEVDPKFAEAYYHLALVEYADSNLKGAKANFIKYIEIAPNGKNAADARTILEDPSLKNLK